MIGLPPTRWPWPDPSSASTAGPALRVADAGVMPTVVSGNTNAACVIIGEKRAEIMLAGR